MHRRSWILVVILSLPAGCKKPPAQPIGVTSATSSVSTTASTQPPTSVPRLHDCLDRVRTQAEQTALESDIAALQKRASPSPFGLVALSTKHPLNLWVSGDHVLVWGKDQAASANGDGALALVDTWKGLPYDPDKHRLLMAGSYPNLIAFRLNDAYCDTAEFGTTAYFRRNGRWQARQPPKADPAPPYAFVTWTGAGLLVYSVTPNCGAYTSSGPISTLERSRRGTTLVQLDPTGNWSHPTLGLDPSFIAWDASSSDDSLALLGSVAVRAPNATDDSVTTPDIVVMRRKVTGAFRAHRILHQEEPGLPSPLARVREFGTAALVMPPPIRDDSTPSFGCLSAIGDEAAWKGRAGAITIVTDDETKSLAWRKPAEQDCHAADAVLTDDEVFVMVSCPMPPTNLSNADENYAVQQRWLLRISQDGKREFVALPKLEPPGGLHCEPRRIELRAPSDLWVLAECRSSESSWSAVFRRGHPQAPLTMASPKSSP